MTNPNTIYANTFIDALVAAGLKHVCLAPGSRHTALVLAFARHRQAIHLSSHLDERSAAFFALGQALATAEPVALVCTSGSAAANFFPAIIEARQSRIPLLVLTADRPPELRASGANQTIDQIKLYGAYADWFYEAPLPEAKPPPAALRNLSTLAARAFAIARQQRGVVHINLPFRKPFEPTAAMPPPSEQQPQFLEPGRAEASGLPALLDSLGDDILKRRGLIYFGHGACRSEAEQRALRPWATELARVTGFPILAEFSSNMRVLDRPAYSPISAYETVMPALDFSAVEVLLRFGAPPLCKNMQDFIANARLRYHIFGSRAGEWADDSHSVTHHLTIDPATVNSAEWQTRPAAPPACRAWQETLSRAEQIAWSVIAEDIAAGAYFDGAVLYDIVDLLPAGAALFAGNSLPIRQLDQFCPPRAAPPLTFANRGASGIDGNVSTALGIGAARVGQPLVAVLGDITLYHDMNGLLAARRGGTPITIVLLNNDGGGIFQRLPVRAFEPHFSDYFITAHGLDFAQVARLYGLEYARATDRASFRQAFSASMHGRGATLIEVRTEALADLRRRADIMAAVAARLRESGEFGN